jgi:hypothetical protein
MKGLFLMKYLYRFTESATGRKGAQVYDRERKVWRRVGVNAALSMIAGGRGVEVIGDEPVGLLIQNT